MQTGDRLKIKNYAKIVGDYGNYSIMAVTEEPNYYTFMCKRGPSSGIKNIRLNRNGWLDGDGDVVFHFGDSRKGSQLVTADWFSNIENAAKAILTECKTSN